MGNKYLSVAESGTPANLQRLLDDVFDTLEWADVEAEAFNGFLVKYVSPGQGPDGVTVFLGDYPIVDQSQLFVLSVFFSTGEAFDPPPVGLHYQRAAIGKAGV